MGLSEYMINEEAFDYSSFIELLYKNESKGYVSLFRKGFTGIFQKAYKKNDLFKGVKNFFDTEFNTDLYMSMNTFYKPERTKENLRYLNSLYIDLDYYKMNLNRQEVLSKLEDEYFNKSIPVPSMIVDSGRGLYLIWLIEQVPSKVVSLWSAMQHYLYDKLKSLGADRQALDPSRILRVIGSYNTKSNTNVKLLRFEFVRYTLKKLKEMYLPKVTKKLETKKKAFKGKIVKFFNIYSLYKARIDDLEKLAELRGYDLEGKRELILFIYRYYNEILEGKERALELTYEFNNKFIKPLSLSEVRSSTKSNYIGKYNYRNSTLVELLDISKDEMEFLSSMVTEEVKYERNNERRKRNRRNEDGLTKREAKKRANLIEVLKGIEDKISTKEIAETLGISDRMVRKYKKELENNESLRSELLEIINKEKVKVEVAVELKNQIAATLIDMVNNEEIKEYIFDNTNTIKENTS